DAVEDIDERKVLDEPLSEDEFEGTQALAAQDDGPQIVDAADNSSLDDEPGLKQHVIVAADLSVEPFDRLDDAQPDASLEAPEATETSAEVAPVPNGKEIPDVLEVAAAAAVDT